MQPLVKYRQKRPHGVFCNLGIRASDFACHQAGDKFFVIATNTDQTAGLQLAERIFKSIE